MSELSLSIAEFTRLYSGQGGYRDFSRQLAWVTMADVFNDTVAYALCPPDRPETFVQLPTDIDPADEKAASQFFTMFADMEPHHAREIRWTFAHSHADPDFLEAVRRFPLVHDRFAAQGLRAARLWAEGEYMAQSLMLLEGIPADYAYSVHPRREPVLLFP